MSGNAIETLREKADLFVPTGFRDEDGVWHDGPHRIEFDTALAAVEALLEAAKPLTQYDFAATQWIAGLEHDGHELRAIHAEDVENLKREVAVLATAVRRLEAGS